MIYSDSDIYAVQLLTYFITQHNYKIVTLRQTTKNDYWLANADNKEYPILRICNEPVKELVTDELYLKGIHQAIATAISRESRLIILNTSESTADLENGIITQFKVVPNSPIGGGMQSAFTGIENVAHHVSNNQDEYARCSRLIERKTMAPAMGKRFKFKDLPRTTLVLIIICAVMFLVTNLLTGVTGDVVSASIFAGGYYKMSVVAGLEYFRLFTSGFVHYDLFHFLMNMMALINLGLICEKRFNKINYLMIMFLGIIIGNVFVLIGDPNIAGMGISGGLFALLGAYVVSLFEDGSIKNPVIRMSLISTIMMNVFISFLPNISLMAHLGGFIAGVVLGFILIPTKRWKTLKVHVRNAGLLLLIGLLMIIPQVQRIDPVYPGTDAYLITTARKLHLDFYADYMHSRFTQQMSRQNDGGYTVYLEQAIKQIEEKE